MIKNRTLLCVSSSRPRFHTGALFIEGSRFHDGIRGRQIRCGRFKPQAGDHGLRRILHEPPVLFRPPAQPELRAFQRSDNPDMTAAVAEGRALIHTTWAQTEVQDDERGKFVTLLSVTGFPIQPVAQQQDRAPRFHNSAVVRRRFRLPASCKHRHQSRC